jgi:hypothetical protein
MGRADVMSWVFLNWWQLTCIERKAWHSLAQLVWKLLFHNYSLAQMVSGRSVEQAVFADLAGAPFSFFGTWSPDSSLLCLGDEGPKHDARWPCHALAHRRRMMQVVRVLRVSAWQTSWRVATLGEDAADIHAVPGGMAADAVEGVVVWPIDVGEQLMCLLRGTKIIKFPLYNFPSFERHGTWVEIGQISTVRIS